MKTRTIKRKCLVCGRSITANVDQRGRYDNGHYFGTVKLPVGDSEWRKIKPASDKEFGVVEWTGKKKKVEYWECGECFEEAENETDC